MNKKYHKGRGAQIQPVNNFIKNAIVNAFPEAIDEEEIQGKIERQIFEDNSVKIINRVQSPDLGFMYSMNPYQGCEHGCVYCYARNSHQYWGFSAGIDFETRLIVKRKAPDLLERQLLHPRWKATPIVMSGNTDCYQPLERELKITRKCLEVFLKYKHPVSIITKNQMILRDMDILQELARQDLVHVYISINSADQSLVKIMEPRTASPQNRLKVIEKLSMNGIPVGAMVAPVIPGLNHHEIPDILRLASNAGASAAGYTIIRLNGKVEEIFRDWLEKNFPDRYHKVIHHIEDLHGGKVNDSQWFRRMKGSGNFGEIIENLYRISKKKYFKDKKFPPYNLNLFRKGGNYQLF